MMDLGLTAVVINSSIFWDLMPFSRRKSTKVSAICFMLISCLVYCFPLKTEAIYWSQESIHFQRATRRYIPNIEIFDSFEALPIRNRRRQVFPCSYSLPWHQMEVNGQLHAPAVLPRGKRSSCPLDRRLISEKSLFRAGNRIRIPQTISL
jgi:hypothetical protein